MLPCRVLRKYDREGFIGAEGRGWWSPPPQEISDLIYQTTPFCAGYGTIHIYPNFINIYNLLSLYTLNESIDGLYKFDILNYL